MSQQLARQYYTIAVEESRGSEGLHDCFKVAGWAQNNVTFSRTYIKPSRQNLHNLHNPIMSITLRTLQYAHNVIALVIE